MTQKCLEEAGAAAPGCASSSPRRDHDRVAGSWPAQKQRGVWSVALKSDFYRSAAADPHRYVLDEWAGRSRLGSSLSSTNIRTGPTRGPANRDGMGGTMQSFSAMSAR